MGLLPRRRIALVNNFGAGFDASVAEVASASLPMGHGLEAYATSASRCISVAAAVSAAQLSHRLIRFEPIQAGDRPCAGITRTTGNGKRSRNSS